MPRPPVGKTRQDASTTALFAAVAGKLSGISSARQTKDAWLRDDLGLKIRSNAIDRVGPRLQAVSRGWLLVNERLIGLETVLVVFPGVGRPRPELIRRLTATGAVRQRLETRSRRDILCVLMFEPCELDRVYATIESLGEAFVWEQLVADDRTVEAATWANLARRAAENEDLVGSDRLLPPGRSP